MSVTNPAPSQITTWSVVGGVRSLAVSIPVRPADNDLAGVIVLAKAGSGQTLVFPDDVFYRGAWSDMIVIDTDSSNVALLPNQTYTVKVAAFDEFGSDSLTFSSALEATTSQIGSNDVADAAIINSKIGQNVVSTNYNGSLTISGNVDVTDIGDSGWAISKDGIAVFKEIYSTSVMASGVAFPGIGNAQTIATDPTQLNPQIIYIPTGFTAPLNELYEKSRSCRIGSVKISFSGTVSGSSPVAGDKLFDFRYETDLQFYSGGYYVSVPSGATSTIYIVLKIVDMTEVFTGFTLTSAAIYDINWTLDDIG